MGQLVRRQGPEARPRVLQHARRRPRDLLPGLRRAAASRPTQLDTWKHDRQGAIVGDVLAKKLGWKVGDKVTLESGIYPGDWEFTSTAIYTTTARSVDRSTLLFHWDYLNDALPAARRDKVGWIVSRVDEPGAVGRTSAWRSTSVFDERDTQTLSQDERSFNASFLAMFSAILKAMDIVSAVILVIMTLILGNTIAMGVRERTSEYGVLRAIGFLPEPRRALGRRRVAGPRRCSAALLGVALAWPFVEPGDRPLHRGEHGLVLPLLPADAREHGAGASASRRCSAAPRPSFPAWRASQLKVVDALRRVA